MRVGTAALVVAFRTLAKGVLAIYDETRSHR
jgi:hypothetical protein